MRQYRDAKHEFSRTLDNGVTLDVWCRSFGPVATYSLLCGGLLLSEYTGPGDSVESFFKAAAQEYEGDEGKQRILKRIQGLITKTTVEERDLGAYLRFLKETARRIKRG